MAADSVFKLRGVCQWMPNYRLQMGGFAVIRDLIRGRDVQDHSNVICKEEFVSRIIRKNTIKICKKENLLLAGDVTINR